MKTVFARIKQEWSLRPFNPHEPIVIGVSGGADSMALLYFLLHEGEQEPDSIIAVHVNHKLRPTAADDAAFVSEICANWGVPCVIATVDTPQLQAEEKRSVEDAAREGRYRQLQAIAQEHDAAVVLTAHHADDQVETVLMNLLRGSGSNGLVGMRPVSSRQVNGRKMVLYRPFLGLWRTEVLAYAREHRIPFIEDPSNEDVAFQRNRLRHQLIPLLSDYNLQAKQHIWQLSKVVAEEQEGWEQLIERPWAQIVLEANEQVVRFDLTQWNSFHASIQRAFLRKGIAMVKGNMRDIGFNHLEETRLFLARQVHGAEAQLPQHLRVVISYDEAFLFNSKQISLTELMRLPLLPSAEPIALNLEEPIVLTNGWVLIAERVDSAVWDDRANVHNRWEASVACKSEGQLFLRGRQQGEKFRPLGMSGRMKLKDLMIDEKIPAVVRKRWPIVADEEGVLWVVGHRLAERAAVDVASVNVIHIKVEKQTSE